MNDIRRLIEAVTRLNEAQKYDFLDAIVNRYAKEGMTLEDLRNMERAAREARPPEGLLSGFITPSYRVRYTLAHAAKKLDLPGLYNERGNFVFLDDQGEAAGAASANRGEAEQLARVGLLPQDKAQRFNIQIGQPRTRGLTGADGGGAGAQAFAVADPAPITTVEPAVDAQADDAARTAPAAGGASALERFANSGKGGLRNDPDETEAITELQTFLVNELGLDTGGIGNGYGGKTQTAVRQFQRAVTGIAQDGDAGPETIGKIVEIRRDMARIQELLTAIEDSNITDSVVPVRFKSGLAQLLERELTQQERTELQQLVSKYENFRQAFPNFQKDLFQQAEFGSQLPNAQGNAPAAQTVAPAQPPAPGTGTTPTISGSNDQRSARTAPERPGALSADGPPLPGAPEPASADGPPLPGAPEPASAANLVADPERDGVVDDPEAAMFLQDRPTAAMQIWRAKGFFNDSEQTVFDVLDSVVKNQQDWTRLQRDFVNLPNNRRRTELVPYLQSFLNDGEMQRFVWDAMPAGISRSNRPGPNNQPAANAVISRVPGAQTQSVDFDNLNYIKEMVRKICN